jgi:hypothetical protein
VVSRSGFQLIFMSCFPNFAVEQPKERVWQCARNTSASLSVRDLLEPP